QWQDDRPACGRTGAAADCFAAEMRTGRPEEVLEWLKPGQRVYFQGGPGECGVFRNLLEKHSERAAGVELWSCFVPGINTFDYGALTGGPSFVTFMASPALEASIASGRTTLRAMPYSQIGELLERTEFDLAILHAAMPDENGRCSFGVAADAPGIAARRAAKRVVFLNRQMPAIADAVSLGVGEIDLGVLIDAPLLSAEDRRETSAPLSAIADRAAGLIADGATIQSGIGEAPGAVVAALKERRRLKVHSGIITPEYRLLAEASALDANARHVAGIAWGGRDFYDWLGRERMFAFRSIHETHGAAELAGIPNFVSVGSAIEVDVFGNINLEWIGSRRVSSVGGAPDYVRGARGSPGGRSIIALPSTGRGGNSRIVARLERVSIPSELADAVVTEHGVAELRGLPPEKRAAVMLAIAAPAHRALLAATLR
ncbi:MAG TPA: acetyl-CoA hydrolase/transferase C-terminal domain-containing protein, partial [Hyphomonadaceae bacterium]|nr:acetyl-CoA hydrolase/transferase C-terminal domain-containing protein [Hyphomonadaceae bacterium]